MAEGIRLIESNAHPQTQLLERDTIFAGNVYFEEVQEIEELFISIALIVRLEADQGLQTKRGSGDDF